MRNEIDTNMLIVTARGDGADHGKPEHDEFHEFVGPRHTEAAAQQLTIDDLKYRYADHRADQNNQRGILREPPCPLQPIQESFQWVDPDSAVG